MASSNPRHHLLAAGFALLFIGAGCAKTSPTASTPTGTQTAVTEDQQAALNRDAEATANESTVALIVTEGQKTPDGATVESATIGCNDRVAIATVPRITATNDVVKDALTSLFAVRDSNYHGFYNALWQSSFKVDKVQSTDGVTTEVWLTGKPMSGGVCDDPRIKAQIEETVRRLRPKFKIFLNGSQAHYACIGNESGNCTIE